VLIKTLFLCYFEPFLHTTENMHTGLFKYAFFIVHINEKMYVKFWGVILLLSGPLGPHQEWEATANKLLAIC
jgi:hypothetical protein